MKFPLEVPPGTVTDETRFSAPGVWADSNNVRYRYGRPEPIGGWAKVFATQMTGAVRGAFAWRDNLSFLNIAFGTSSKLYVNKDGTLADITPIKLPPGFEDFTSGRGWGGGAWGAGGWGGGPLTETWPRTWSLQNFGQILLANPRGWGLYAWTNDTDTPAALVAGAPIAMAAVLVTPQRQVLALGCTEYSSGQINPMVIRGSDLRDHTSWTIANDRTAFEQVLQGGGRIINGAVVGNDVLIWTDTAVYYGQYLGYSNQSYRFDRLADNCGLAAPNAFAVINQVAYWLTPDLQFYTWRMGGVPAPVPCPLGREFRDNIDAVEIDKVCAFSLSEFNEVWWFYPDSRDGNECSRYIAVGLDEGAWFKGTIARTAGIDSGPTAYPLAVSDTGYAYYHDCGTTADGGDFDWHFQTSDIYLDEGERRVLVRGITPDFKDQSGDVTLTIVVKDYPQSTGVTKGPYTLAAGRAKRDFMLSGRLISVKFAGSSGFVRYGKPVFDVQPAGKQ